MSMAAVALAIDGGGALSSFETTVLLTVDETMDALRKAEDSQVPSARRETACPRRLGNISEHSRRLVFCHPDARDQRLETSTGVELLVMEPLPSWPFELSPQHFSRRSFVIAHECKPPTAIAVIPLVKPETATG